jgi:hypothetical protein
MNVIFQEIGALANIVLRHHADYTVAVAIAAVTNPVIVFEDYADNANSSLIDVIRQIRTTLAKIRNFLGPESNYIKGRSSMSTAMFEINNKQLEGVDLLKEFLLKMEKSPLHIFFYMLRCHDSKYHFNPFYKKRKLSNAITPSENPMTYKQFQKHFCFKFLGTVYKVGYMRNFPPTLY